MAITRIQSASGTGAASTTCVVTLGASPTNGNFLVAVIATTSVGNNPVTSVTETGATWVNATTIDNSAGVSLDIWYAANVSGAGTGVTFNLAASLTSGAIVVEYSGGALTGLLDQTATNSGTNGTQDTGTTATTSQNNELWVGGLSELTGASGWNTPTNGFVNVIGLSGSPSVVFEEKIVTATGTANTQNQTNVGAFPDQWAGGMATFKDVNAGVSNSGNFFFLFRP